jgi:hypothetical protein
MRALHAAARVNPAQRAIVMEKSMPNRNQNSENTSKGSQNLGGQNKNQGPGFSGMSDDEQGQQRGQSNADAGSKDLSGAQGLSAQDRDSQNIKSQNLGSRSSDRDEQSTSGRDGSSNASSGSQSGSRSDTERGGSSGGRH